LACAGLNISILAARKYGHKYLNRNDLSAVPIDELELLTGKVDEHFFARYVLEFHRPFFFWVFTPVMFQELGIAVRFCCQLNILLIVVQKSEAGMVPGLVDPFEIK